MDCILFSNYSYLILKHYNEKYGNDFKYLEIKKDKWGDGENDFHQFLIFKYKDGWYFLDRFEIRKAKPYDYLCEKIDLQEFTDLELALYRSKCGFKSEEEAQNNIFEVTNKHLFDLTRKKYTY